jgi:hypothetical protein
MLVLAAAAAPKDRAFWSHPIWRRLDDFSQVSFHVACMPRADMDFHFLTREDTRNEAYLSVGKSADPESAEA